jgi:hypothetical protein
VGLTAEGRQRFYPPGKNGNGEGAKRGVGEKTKSQTNRIFQILSMFILSKMILLRFTVSPFHRFLEARP